VTDYPHTRRGNDVTVVHGRELPDPYRWLEDTWSDETASWVKQQNELTESFLATLPGHDAVRSRLTEIWDHDRVGVPHERGGRWFQLRHHGLAPQPVLMVIDGPDGDGQVLLDPNAMSEGGTVALSEWTVSSDGRLLAYATSDGGSDWMTWRVRDVDTGDDRPDVLEWSKFTTAVWSPDGTDLYYVAYDAPRAGRELLDESRVPRVMRHRLGTPATDDGVVFVNADHPDWGAHLASTEDGRFLVVAVSRGTFTENQLHVLDLTRPDAGFVPLVDDFSCFAAVAGNDGDTFYLCTDDAAERRRVVSVDLSSPGKAGWREVVPQTEDTLLDAHLFGGRLVTHYLRDAHSRLLVRDLAGGPVTELDIGGIASVVDLSGHPDSPLMHIGTTSFTDPGSVWSCDLDTGETRRIVTTDVVDADRFVTTQVFAPSSDGVKVPVFLVHRDDVTPTGDVPVLLYGYGGFNIPMTPSFSAVRAVWVERGGLLAVACLRGGGEYGRSWYDAGRLANKQNVFDDFCHVARWLATSGWSRPDRIAIHGGSNGGLLVGTCLTQHPELFGAAVPVVGVLDMLRFHLFTIGWAWVSDYGSVDDPEAAANLLSYSPLHNVREGASYPATLVITGDHDDRVAPGHSFKFTAALQAAQAGKAPILIRVETDAGHGMGKPTAKLIDEGVDMLTFLEAVLAL
jgi:prolyl oligopeptidase